MTTTLKHEAAAAVLVQGSRAVETQFYLVTAEGKVFKRAAHAELEGLLLISGVDRTEYLQRKQAGTLTPEEHSETPADTRAEDAAATTATQLQS